jgi:putative DNA methylase
LTYRKKLVEVALPPDEINAESAREKSIRHGHPSTLHPWWAERPPAASYIDGIVGGLPEERA